MQNLLWIFFNSPIVLADPPTNTDSGSDFPEDRSPREQLTTRGTSSHSELIDTIPESQLQLSPNLKLTGQSWTGRASYYSRAGCVWMQSKYDYGKRGTSSR